MTCPSNPKEEERSRGAALLPLALSKVKERGRDGLTDKCSYRAVLQL